MEQGKVVIPPMFVWICNREKCHKELRDCFELDEDEAMDNDDWRFVTMERALEVIKRRGWFVDETGYLFCSVECHSIALVEHEDSFRRMRYGFTKELGDACPEHLRFGVK